MGGLECAIPAASVQEVLPAAALALTPGRPPVLEGFLNLRGQAIPVFDLRRLLGLAPREMALYSHVVMIKNGRETAGILVDRVEGVADVPDAALQPLPSGHSFNDCAEARFPAGGRDIIALSCERLLLDEERRRVSELRAAAQRRLDELEASAE